MNLQVIEMRISANRVGQILRVSFLMKLVGFHIRNVWIALPNYIMII